MNDYTRASTQPPDELGSFTIERRARQFLWPVQNLVILVIRVFARSPIGVDELGKVRMQGAYMTER